VIPKFLSDDSIATLRRLLGVSIHKIFTPSLDAAGAHLAAPSLSFLLGKDSFINFSCVWHETPKFLNDSWQLEVCEATDPTNIKMDSSRALLEPCSISLYHSKPIATIEIFNYRLLDDEEEENVHYDQAILFRCTDGRAFCISCMLNGPGIAEFLHFSEDQIVIREMLNSSNLRLTLE